jgi:predicted phage baseplate assembly protein
MSLTDPLCRLPVPPAGCCDAPPEPPAAPARPDNPPGLSTIGYRIGTFTSFRRTMLDEVARADLLGAGTPNPFAAWREGADGDYQTLFVELWAYLADVLSFYQERIANEAYLPTAVRRDSLLRLAGLIDYRAGPGAGAGGLVAFTVEPGRSVTVPVGFRIGSRAAPGRPAAVFETDEAVTALGEHSRIALAATAPVDQLAQPTGKATRQVVLTGTANRLAVGDRVLVVEHQGQAGEKATARQLTGVDFDPAAGTTTISWVETPSARYAGAALYALRVTAAPFGSQAPDWNTLPATLTGTVSGVDGPFKGRNWDDPGGAGPWPYLPTPGDPGEVVFLDAVYDGVTGTPERPGWALLLADDDRSQVVHVVDARPAGKAAYAMSAKVTRLTLREKVAGKTFRVRRTLVLAGSERLELASELPLPAAVSGDTLVLAGLHPRLRSGQIVALQGRLAQPAAASPTEAVGAEAAVLAGEPTPDASAGTTTVRLRQPLRRSYLRADTALLANVTAASQGETVRDEVLGSGDASAFQSFPLRRKPLTYLPTSDPEGLSAVASTLLVTVNQVRWEERRTLLGGAPDAQAFTTTLDDSGQTTVVFGDGFHGARPPTGRDNVRARYRKGLGSSGNVAAGAVRQLIDSLPGLQAVSNPQPTLGGTEPESADQLRTNAPATVRTFGRAVSIEDHATLALRYPGVAKASAAWVLRDPVTLRALPQPYVQLTVATADQVPLREQPTLAAALRAFLDRRRDPNVPLRIGDVTPVHVDLAATVEVDDRFSRQRTLALALAALNPGRNPDGSVGFFAMERLEFGQSVSLSAVYAALQAVPGVREATVTTLRRVGGASPDPPGTVRDHVFVRPTEIVTIANDPTDQANQFGKVTITLGSGGVPDR